MLDTRFFRLLIYGLTLFSLLLSPLTPLFSVAIAQVAAESKSNHSNALDHNGMLTSNRSNALDHNGMPSSNGSNDKVREMANWK